MTAAADEKNLAPAPIPPDAVMEDRAAAEPFNFLDAAMMMVATELAAELRRRESFDEAMITTILNAMKPEVEVRIHFDSVKEAHKAGRLLYEALYKLKLLDLKKTKTAIKHEAVFELTNGSCVLFRLDKTRPIRP